MEKSEVDVEIVIIWHDLGDDFFFFFFFFLQKEGGRGLISIPVKKKYIIKDLIDIKNF